MWQELLRNKYIKDKTLGSCTKKPTYSHFWKGLMNVKDTFMSFGSFKVKNGSQTHFWMDTWLGNQLLKDRVLASVPLNISFHRNLVGTNLRDWHRIVASIQDVNLQGESDSFVWALHSSGSFSIKSMYVALINNRVRVSQDIWQIKIPIRIKIFLWYLKRCVILTKDNLAQRNWNGDTRCSLCHNQESIHHLFF
jgi:hypothetical protein